mmetsp:Transcript_2072/g.5706  ORF Transcript_2072/g.5706 Transcript_2072/m.5706 type:complete len:249 (-) Transcript_2072:100-846(-)
MSLLPRYFEHCRLHRTTLLCRFFGLFTITLDRGRTATFALMSNIFDTELAIHERYDLKGSIVGRRTKAKDKTKPNVTLKDQEFRRSSRILHLGHTKKAVMAQLRLDVELLAAENLMDYSLIVGVSKQFPDSDTAAAAAAEADAAPEVDVDLSIASQASDEGAAMVGCHRQRSSMRLGQWKSTSWFHGHQGGIQASTNDEVYFLGVVDLLQSFEFQKKLQAALSSKGSSAIPPKEYAERFLHFIDTVLD